MFTRRLLKLRIHSRRVLIFKRSLPIFAFLLAGVMIVWPNLSEQKDKFTARQLPDDAIKGATINMEDVRFFSKDSKDKPISIVAKSVQETDSVKKIITLNEPVATYQMNNKTQLFSKTSYALVFQKEEYLYCSQPVTTTTDTGWQADSVNVIYDYKTGTLESESPVFVKGPDGTLEADKGFFIQNKGDLIDFYGHTKTHIVSLTDKIKITSENGLKINQLNKTITAMDNVVVYQKDYTITADEMTLFYVDGQKGKDKIKEIVATGHVVASNGVQKMTGDTGVYNPKTGIIKMMGHVVMYQGDNQAKGDTATFNLNTGKSSLNAIQTGNKPARIRGTFVPAKIQSEDK